MAIKLMFIAIMLKSSLFWIYADGNGAILAICLFYNLQFTFPLIIYSMMYFKLYFSYSEILSIY